MKLSEPYKPGATEGHRGHERAEVSAARIAGGRDRQSGEFRKTVLFCCFVLTVPVPELSSRTAVEGKPVPHGESGPVLRSGPSRHGGDGDQAQRERVQRRSHPAAGGKTTSAIQEYGFSPAVFRFGGDLIVPLFGLSQLMTVVQKLISNRKVQEQQMALANQAVYLNQLALQNGLMGAGGLSQLDLLGLYQQLHGLHGPHQGMGKNPGPSKGL